MSISSYFQEWPSLGYGTNAYFEDVKQQKDSIVDYISPHKTMHSVVESCTAMCHKQSYVL